MFSENYYPTNNPCDVCGKVGSNGIEPRFLYTVCEEHSSMSPVQISEATKPPGNDYD